MRSRRLRPADHRIRTLERLAWNQGYRAVFLSVDPIGNPRAHALYQSLGYDVARMIGSGWSFLTNNTGQAQVISNNSYSYKCGYAAELHRTVIAGVDLSHARGLTQEQVDEACADSKTRLPSGFTARSCAGIRAIIHQAGSAMWGAHAYPTPPTPPSPPALSAPPAPPAPPATPTRYLLQVLSD